MATSKKALLAALLISVVSFAVNVSVFLYGYQRLAIPFLNEEQRVINAEFIMTVIVGAFAAAAALTGSLVHWLCVSQRK